MDLTGRELLYTDTGQLVVTHGEAKCVPPCAIHSPSDHHMREWPLHWRGDRKILERICCDGIGHPDPDNIDVRLGFDTGNHSCDGCCVASSSDEGRET